MDSGEMFLAQLRFHSLSRKKKKNRAKPGPPALRHPIDGNECLAANPQQRRVRLLAGAPIMRQPGEIDWIVQERTLRKNHPTSCVKKRNSKQKRYHRDRKILRKKGENKGR